MTDALACGTDVVAVERIRDLVERFGDSFLDRVYTEREVAYCRSRADPPQHLAARWAAKEAAVKALPETGLVHGDVEVVRDPDTADPRPRLALYGRAAVHADRETAVSLSHDATLGVATAHVVVRGPGGADADGEDRSDPDGDRATAPGTDDTAPEGRR